MTDYQQKLLNLWQQCSILSNLDQVQAAANFIVEMKEVYTVVCKRLNMPFWVVGCIHYRESNFDFSTYLQNGDPLFDSQGNPIQTTHVPVGVGPFDSWASAAYAALIEQGWGAGYHWDATNALENMEAYNGPGYKEMGLPSPYLWSFTNNYSSGKYTSDGNFDPNAVDQQAGVAAIMLSLRSLGVEFADSQ